MAITRSQSSRPGKKPGKPSAVETTASGETTSKISGESSVAPGETSSRISEESSMAPVEMAENISELKSFAPGIAPDKESVEKNVAPVEMAASTSELKSLAPGHTPDKESVEKNVASVEKVNKVSGVKSLEVVVTADNIAEEPSAVKTTAQGKTSSVEDSLASVTENIPELKGLAPGNTPDKESVEKNVASVKKVNKVSGVKSLELVATADNIAEEPSAVKTTVQGKTSSVEDSLAPVTENIPELKGLAPGNTPDKESVEKNVASVKKVNKVSGVKSLEVVATADNIAEEPSAVKTTVQGKTSSVEGSLVPVTENIPKLKGLTPGNTLDKESAEKNVAPVKKVNKVSGVKSLEVVATADNIAWLAATPELVQCARAASEFLFSALAVNKESQLEKLLTENFDPEQIWQQIDLQATPVLSLIRKSLRKIEKTPPRALMRLEEKSMVQDRSKSVDFEVTDAAVDEDDDQGEDYEVEEVVSGDEDEVDGSGDEDEEEETSKSEEEFSDYDEEEKKAVEDKFLKLSDMEKFLDRADAEDAGIPEAEGDDAGVLSEEDDEEEEDEDLEMDEAFDFSARLAGKDKGDEGWGPKYSDFIGKGKKEKPKPSKHQDESVEHDLEEEEDEEDEEPGTMDIDQRIEPVEEKKLSAHERQQEKTKRRVEKLEMENLESKDWTMQGEVSASRRSKNSALEVELDFEHVARPAPVMTEEHRQSLEDMIRSRIIEGRFDDPRPRAAPSTGFPKERTEMDEEKSKKGLGEIYEQEYMENTGLAVAATPAMETLKAEAKILFKNLCNRLDALSHFHFAPKPTVEEMEVKVDVPALAMEEVAPLAISDASMLAPEEVYKSAGLVKGESELTPEERKRRRALKKRKRKGAKNAEENRKKLRMNNAPMKDPLKELNVRSAFGKDKRTTSSFSKSAKVFAELDKAHERGNKSAKPVDTDRLALNASSLKL